MTLYTFTSSPDITTLLALATSPDTLLLDTRTAPNAPDVPRDVQERSLRCYWREMYRYVGKRTMDTSWLVAMGYTVIVLRDRGERVA